MHVSVKRKSQRNINKIICSAAFLCLSVNATAQTHDNANTMDKSGSTASKFGQFAPKIASNNSKIDYGVWDEVLKYFVFRMGKSIREGAPRPESGLGTRRIYGHDSRYRLEGNRVIFSYFNDEIIAALTEYRKDLENTANIVDISKLAKNEQLAYWINLHNAAVIEQIAIAYPVGQPSRIKIGDSGLPLDDAPFITVLNVKMSPKDIRTKIVYPHWRNPKVIYGFFRGEIGGPSIQGDAFNAGNVSDLLDKSAKEFVNSLRGTQKSGKTLLVSKIFEEARPYFFPEWPTDLKAHLREHAEQKVTSIIDRTTGVLPKIYETDIADLANGERDPNYGFVTSNGVPKGGKIPSAIRRLLREHRQKFDKIIRRDGLRGIVTVLDIDLPGEPKKTKEVD